MNEATTDSPVLDAVPHHEALFWELLEEFHAKPEVRRTHSPYRERRSTVLMARRRPALNPASLMRKAGLDKYVPFTPTVGCLAGLVVAREWSMPDLAAVSLYQDGDDWLAPHLDYEALFGPTPKNVIVTIFSFGAPRTMLFWPLDAERDLYGTVTSPPHHEVKLLPGSAFTMRGRHQRQWLHSISRDRRVRRPRLSVSFLYDQQRSEECAWMLSRVYTTRAGDDDLAPLFFGTQEECTRHWGELVESAEGEQLKYKLQSPTNVAYTDLEYAKSGLHSA